LRESRARTETHAAGAQLDAHRLAQIPGLNAPIPPGTDFGYAPGQWGKPPVDESGIPLYGDVFGEALGEESDDEQACCCGSVLRHFFALNCQPFVTGHRGCLYAPYMDASSLHLLVRGLCMLPGK